MVYIIWSVEILQGVLYYVDYVSILNRQVSQMPDVIIKECVGINAIWWEMYFAIRTMGWKNLVDVQIYCMCFVYESKREVN